MSASTTPRDEYRDILHARLETALRRLEDKWDTKLHPDTCTAEQQYAVWDTTHTIRKELNQ